MQEQVKTDQVNKAGNSAIARWRETLSCKESKMMLALLGSKFDFECHKFQVIIILEVNISALCLQRIKNVCQ